MNLILLAFYLFIFPALVLYDCIVNPHLTKQSKWVWSGIILLTWFVGASLYSRIISKRPLFKFVAYGVPTLLFISIVVDRHILEKSFAAEFAHQSALARQPDWRLKQDQIRFQASKPIYDAFGLSNAWSMMDAGQCEQAEQALRNSASYQKMDKSVPALRADFETGLRACRERITKPQVGTAEKESVRRIQRVLLPVSEVIGKVLMFRDLRRTVPMSVAFKEAIGFHLSPQTGIDACFDPIRLHIECMRINCIYRTLETTRDEHLCEGLEEKQIHYDINPQWMVTKQDCLDRMAEITNGKAQLSHGTALRVYCSASISHITAGHMPPLSLIAKPGETLHFNYQWIGPGLPPSTFQVFVRITEQATGVIAFQEIYDPPIPTNQWKQTVQYSHDVLLPTTLKPGTYNVVSGLWQPDTKMQVAFKTLQGKYIETFQLAWLRVQ